MQRSGSAAVQQRRTVVVSFLLLLSVFFLPLHYHPLGAAAQITKDCACIHGTRTELGLTSASADFTPVLAFLPVTGEIQDSSGYLLVQSGHIRAPPVAAL
jgi:hypothetical protein